MAANDDVLIVGKLDGKELTDSIDKLIDEVATKSQTMANKFEDAMNIMKSAMKDFAITQKVSVDLMKESWREMSASFDAMFEAEKSATGGGKGSGKQKYDDETLGALKAENAEIEKKLNYEKVYTTELQDGVDLLNRQKNEVKELTTSTSAKELRDALKMPSDDLSEAEKKLQELEKIQRKYSGTTDLSTQQQTKLANAIKKCKQEIDKFNSVKPKTLEDVLGMDESSIEAITKKMQALKRITVDPNNAAQVKQLGDEYQRLSRLQSELLGKNIQHTKSNNYLAQSFGYIRNRIVYALTLGAVTNFTKQVYEIRGQYELLERSLGVLLNSFERGSQVFQELNKMAIESPFTLMELATGAKQLTAYNFAANEVVDTTRRLADISSALGVPMERLVYNLGQIRAQTRLTARDARDFANAGLPIITSLAERYSELEGHIVTSGDVYERMTKKMVSYNDVMAVLNKMTDQGGKFFEFQSKQAETLRVKMANLTLAWNNMLNEIGQTNQSLLTLPISGLKALLQNWQSIDRVLKSIIISLGIMKGAQIAVLMGTTRMTFALAAMTVAGKGLSSVFIKLASSLKALFFNPWTWIFVGITAIIDFVRQIQTAKKEISELNEEIRNNAQEASDSMLKFMNNKGIKATIELAKQNKLSAEEGEKAWDSIREQIEQSAMSSNTLIAQLLKIDDVNKRVVEGFDYVGRIQKSQAALNDLKDDTIEITTDKGWFGMFGKGLVSSLVDYSNSIKDFKGTYKEFEDIINTNIGYNNPIRIYFHEVQNGIDVTANSIKNFISENNITDPLQINEILERVRAKIKEKNPDIKGEAAKMFDIALDKKMSELTKGAVDQNSSLWTMFMDRLKHQSSATFQSINDDWVKSNEKLSQEQQNAVDENLQYFKDSMPYAYDAVAKMVADASQLKIHIGIAFGIQQLSDFQKEVNKRVKEKYEKIGSDQFNALLPTAEDNLDSFVDANQKAIAKLEESNKKYEKDKSEWARKHIAENNTEIEQRKKMLDLFNQSYKKDKKTTTHQKDVLGDALQKEIQIIENIQKRFKEYQKIGVSSQQAIARATEEYGNTLLRTNATLNNYGFKTKSGEQLANMDLRGVRDYFNSLLTVAVSLGNAKGVDALEKAIAGINVEITKIDYKKITDGLNNELSRLKEDYELAIELDANPELGNAFADLFDINLDLLPRTANEYAKKYTDDLNKALKEYGSNIEIPNLLYVTKSDLEEFEAMLHKEDGSMTEAWYNAILKGYTETHNALKKEITDEISDWNNLLKKYSEYEYKLKLIAKEADQDRKSLIMRFGDENQKKRVQTIITELDTEEDPQKVKELRDELNKIIDQVVGDDDLRIQLKVAIDTNQAQDSAQAAFEEFQKKPEWLVATGDLAGMTNDALKGLVKTLEQYKKKGNLTEKQTKQINKAITNLNKQIRKSNPFAFIANTIDNARETANQYEEEIQETDKKMRELEDTKEKDGKLTEKQEKEYEKLSKRLKELLGLQEDASKIQATEIVNGINDAISAAKQATGIFTDMIDALGGANGSIASKRIKEIFGVIEKGGQGAAMGAQIAGGWGALIGGVAGGIAGAITTWYDEWSGNAEITEEIQSSENAIKRLNNVLKETDDAASNAYGAIVSGAQRAVIANKQLQLVEIKRQLELEKSRSSKNRDQDRIVELEGQYLDMLIEIRNGVSDIVNEMLGISSSGDGITALVETMITAFKNGENAMDAFKDKWNEMIDNMILKLVISQYMDNAWKNVMSVLSQKEEEFLAKSSQDAEYAKWLLTDLENASDWDKGLWYAVQNGYESLTNYIYNDDFRNTMIDAANEYMESVRQGLTQAEMANEKASEEYLRWSLDYMMGEGRDYMEQVAQNLLDGLGDWYTFGQDSKNNLSALQQGIQGITEDTAGALEAYMNGVSQQVYYQSDILTEIRDTVIGFDLDVQLATMSQILMQLQSSHQIQIAIQNILNGWSNPSGVAVRVEMV